MKVDTFMAAPRLTLVETALPEEADDRALALALIRKDKSANQVAWNRLLPVVQATLRRLLGPSSDGDDLVQEVFLRFFRTVVRLRDPEALRSFLFGICLRVVRVELRRRWLGRFLFLTDSGSPPEVAADGVDQDAREAVRRYYRLLDGIGGEARSLFVSRHIERLPLAEVAAVHGLSLSTTQRRLARVTRRVAALVQADPVLAEYVTADGEGAP